MENMSRADRRDPLSTSRDGLRNYNGSVSLLQKTPRRIVEQRDVWQVLSWERMASTCRLSVMDFNQSTFVYYDSQWVSGKFFAF